ncbi:acyl-CoA dehydrogenase [Azorhizobium oxalatiphilum]|uniref:Acyl-CoA dehydrogenase n=1 Tax=Azorhizobium oxalatiphilum TaxID=980631 RepID=A0A917CEI9_9HYPH|nr:acyl-CoA dehydrogenase family protein [Azorhizobium oxalatiphilum]GGF86280.1 acyl-CoA dehydrogenase [Azorhizobium oxalatiphilum]
MDAPASAATQIPTAPDWTSVCAIARSHAVAVDEAGRFPVEAAAALRASGALTMALPRDLGGRDMGFATLARMACELGAACASTAMAFAMHHNQLACLIRHAGEGAWLRDFQRRIADEGLLLASATSEEGIGGRLRTSRCAVTPLAGDRFALEKAASAVSYGAEADAYLVTARRAPDADAGDQVLVVLPRDQVRLEAKGGWDALGLRGTASGAFHIAGEGEAGQILPVPFGVIATETMVPTSHILWGAVWLGIAMDVVARCRAFLRHRMRTNPDAARVGLPLLAQMTGLVTDMDTCLRRAIALYEAGHAAREALDIILLKTSLSEMALRVATTGMRVCGLSGYRNDTPYSLGRHLRDLTAAPLMINNDAILGDAGRLLLATRLTVGQFDAAHEAGEEIAQ